MSMLKVAVVLLSFVWTSAAQDNTFMQCKSIARCEAERTSNSILADLFGTSAPPTGEYNIYCRRGRAGCSSDADLAALKRDLQELKDQQAADVSALENKDRDIVAALRQLALKQDREITDLNALIAELTRRFDESLTTTTRPTTTTTTTVATTTLPPGIRDWYKASNGYRYKFFGGKINWVQAKAHCDSLGAILLSAGFRDRTVQQELKARAGSQSIWIGADDQQQEGRWMWQDGVQATNAELNWKPGEPNNYAGIEDCAFVKAYSWASVDIDCPSKHRLPYFCEYIVKKTA